MLCSPMVGLLYIHHIYIYIYIYLYIYIYIHTDIFSMDLLDVI